MDELTPEQQIARDKMIEAGNKRLEILKEYLKARDKHRKAREAFRTLLNESIDTCLKIVDASS